MDNQLRQGELGEESNISLEEPLLLAEHQEHQFDDGDDEHQLIIDSDLIPVDTSVFSGDRVDDSLHICDGLPYRTSVLIKSLYFLDALSSSTWGRFSAIYYNLHGLNSQHIGLIEGIRTAVPTISQVFWGVVADSLHSRKKVWVGTKAMNTATLLMLALPGVYSSFALVLSTVIFAQLFVSDGILDSFTLDMLGTENKGLYGRYRLYSSVSWGLGSAVMGLVTNYYGFLPNFVLFGLLGGLMICLVALSIPDTTQNRRRTEDMHVGKISELLCLFLQPRNLFFLFEVIILGAAMSTVESLLFLYLVNDLQASTLLCGLSVGVNVLLELPVFWYAPKLMTKFGHDGLFMLSMACFVIRVYGYTLLTPATKWFVLILELIHGITFACFWISCTDISKFLVNKTRSAFWSTTIPSSVNMLYSAVGYSLGSVIGGWAMNKYGSSEMYRYTASFVFMLLLIHGIGSKISRLLYGCDLLPGTEIDDNEEGGSPEPESENPLEVEDSR